MRAVEVPIYDFTRHQRSRDTRRVEPADVVILEVRAALSRLSGAPQYAAAGTTFVMCCLFQPFPGTVCYARAFPPSSGTALQTGGWHHLS